MNKTFLPYLSFTLFFLFTSFFAYASDTPDPNKSSVGTNLAEVADWTTESPFLNVFKTARPWITRCRSGESGCNDQWQTNESPLLELDHNGWVKRLPSAADSPMYTFVSTILFSEQLAGFGGEYVVLYDGDGSLSYEGGGVEVLSSRKGREVINVPGTGQVTLNIDSTNYRDYIRNIRVVRSAAEGSFQEEPFSGTFLNAIAPYHVLRFMDWMHTNNSTQQLWINRPEVSDSSYATEAGVPIEVMVDLVNQTGKIPWFTIPHRADEIYIRNFAEMVHSQLDEKLHVYVEHSNEVWNSGFQQYHDGVAQGNQAFSSGTEFERVLNWHAMKTVQICEIWKEIFEENEERVRCVAGSKGANTYATELILHCSLWSEKRPCYQYIDTVAIAPYFGAYLGDPSAVNQIQSWTYDSDGGLDRLFRELEFGGELTGATLRSEDGMVDTPDIASAYRYGKLPEDELDTKTNNASAQLRSSIIPIPAVGALQNTYQVMDNNRQTASSFGVSLIAYEGGQHLAGYLGAENNADVMELFQRANRDARMGQLYETYLTQWKIRGGDLFVHFNLASAYSKWGSWGASESVNQMGTKALALHKFALRHECWWDSCIIEPVPTVTPTRSIPTATPTPTPTPTKTKMFIPLTPTTTPTPTPTPANAATATAIALLPTATPTQVPTATPTVDPSIDPTIRATGLPATPPPDGSTAVPPTATPTQTPEPTATYTPVPTERIYPTLYPISGATREPEIYGFVANHVAYGTAFRSGYWQANYQFLIKDQNQNPLSNAQLVATWQDEQYACETTDTGVCMIEVTDLPNSQFDVTLQVESLRKNGVDYLNHTYIMNHAYVVEQVSYIVPTAIASSELKTDSGSMWGWVILTVGLTGITTFYTIQQKRRS